MPARFVEVTNLADVARKSDALSFLPSVHVNTSAWTAWLHGTGANTISNGTNSTHTTLGARVLTAVGHVQAPAGPSKCLLVIAATLLLLHTVLMRIATRRALRQYGHAHTE